MQLFLLHFAGGNCYSFQFMRSQFSGIGFIPVELPGRGKRGNEPLVKDLEEAATDLCGEISRRLTDRDFIIYGHSMGALLALKVTGMLERNGRFPQRLVVRGNPGPGIKKYDHRYLLGPEEFRSELKRLGGIPAEFFESEDLYDFFEPILRADFEIAEKDSMSLIPPVTAPIYAIMGEEEEYVESIDNWKRFTSSGFQSEVLPGSHFFIYDHAGRLAEIIKQHHVTVKQCR